METVEIKVEEVDIEFNFKGIYESLKNYEIESIDHISEPIEGELFCVKDEMAIYVAGVAGFVKFYIDDDFIRVCGHPLYLNGELLSPQEFKNIFSSITKMDVSETDSKIFQKYITNMGKDNIVVPITQSMSLKEDFMKTEEIEAVANATAEKVVAMTATAANETPSEKMARLIKEKNLNQPPANEEMMAGWKKFLIGLTTIVTVGTGGYVAYKKFFSGDAL